MNKLQIAELKSFLKEVEKKEVLNEKGNMVTLKSLALTREKTVKETIKENINPVFPIITTALVINNRVSSAKPRQERFFKLYSNIDSLQKLKNVLDKTEPRLFLSKYLNIVSKLDDASKNPKYTLLKNLCEGFLEYKKYFKISSDIKAMIHWADRVDIYKLREDIIGEKFLVGPAVVQNLKITLSYDAIKGDRRVLNNLGKINIKIKAEEVDTIAKQLNISEIYLDTLLFEYGNTKKK